MKKYGWTYKAGLILGILIVIWVAAALLLNTASAEGLPLSLRLSSRLSADYSVDDIGPLKALSLSIIGDMLRDMGMGPREIEDHESAMKALMDDPVPTATARDFEGAAPFTATSTNTATPTNTHTPTTTPTSTFTPRPTATHTPKPTKVKPAATATASGASDTKNPSIVEMGTLDPALSETLGCDFSVTVNGVVIEDEGPSSGIAWVKLKYQVFDHGFEDDYTGLIYSNPLTLCGTSPLSGGGVQACFSGPAPGFEISIYPGFSSLPDYDGSEFKVKIWLKTEDNSGRQDVEEYGAYSVPASCDDP